MTWSELKTQTLRLLGVDADSTDPPTEETAPYLNGMAGMANQAFHYLTVHGRPRVKSLVIDRLSEERAARGVYPLKTLAADFYALRPEEVFVADSLDGPPRRTRRFDVMGEDTLLLPLHITGVWTVHYDAYPPTITAATPGDGAIDLPAECLHLAPLYMASQLFREDDMQRAVQWRNEFEAGCQLLRPVGAGGGFVSASGWCP